MILGNCITAHSSDKPIPDDYLSKTVTSVNNTEALKVGDCAFYECNSLTSVYLPNVKEIGEQAFANCNTLTTIGPDAFQNAETIGWGAFVGCIRLVSVSFPKVTKIVNGAFMACHSLESATFPMCTEINYNAFYGVKDGFVIHLLADSVCSINSSPFGYTSIGAIYVPANLVDSYKAAANWSTYANKIYAEP